MGCGGLMEFDKFLEKQLGLNAEIKTTLNFMNEDIREIKEDIKEIKEHNIQRDLKTVGLASTISIILLILGWIVPHLLSG